MRPEKKYLVDEVGSYLDRTDYIYLADFQGLSVDQTNELRELLAAEEAEFHVVKNSIFNVAAKARDFPDLSEFLSGQNAIIFGGANAAAVAKKLIKFHKDKEKVAVKAGVMENKPLTVEDFKALADLPSKEELQAKFLVTLLAPASTLVRLINTPGVQLATVLDKRREQLEAAG